MPQQRIGIEDRCYGLGKPWAGKAFYNAWPDIFITYTPIMIYVGRWCLQAWVTRGKIVD